MSKIMDNFFGSANTLEKLEETMEKFLNKCKELGVKILTKKFKMGSKVKFGGFLETNKEGRVHIEADPGNKDDVQSFIGLV